MTTTTINREAGDKAKGPRLQRLRCVSLILDAIEKSESPYIYGAVEHKEDVIIKNTAEGIDYLEQNKNFDSSTTFTFNSGEVLNTLVGFCDLWVDYIVKGKDVYLGFYTTKTVGQEQKTEFIKAQNITLPDQPILQLLEAKKIDHPHLLPACRQIILNEYKRQYASKKDNGFLSYLEKMPEDEWTNFFQTIDWKFGEFDEAELKEILLTKIKKCKYFSHVLEGREEIILSRLLDILDEKQCLRDVLGKFINIAEVQLVFKELLSEESTLKSDDPIYRIWETLKPPDDKRTIIDKLNAVCEVIDPKKLALFARKTAGSRIVQEDKLSDKSFLSLRYRIYEKCEAELIVELNKMGKGKISEAEIDTLITHLNTIANEVVNNLSGDFSYSLKSQPVIEGIILELFDSCYLALN